MSYNLIMSSTSHEVQKVVKWEKGLEQLCYVLEITI